MLSVSQQGCTCSWESSACFDPGMCVGLCVCLHFFVFLNLNCLNVITEQQSVRAAYLYGYQSLTLNLISNSNHLPSMMTGPLPKSPCIILTCFSPLHLYN